MVILVWADEVNAALGAKLAQPEKEVYALLGDGSYMMLRF